MEIKSNKFINILKIGECLGTDVTTKLPQIHAATGHDRSSFLHVFVKIKVFKSVSMEKKSSGY